MQQRGPRTISENLDEIRERIARACARAGRSPDEVTLIGVTKTVPVEAIEEARAAGLSDFGENKVQELAAKVESLPGLLSGGGITWHMIGHLQRNKSRDVLRTTDVFHGLDSLRLADELEKRAEGEGRVLPCLVQVNISGEQSKSGVAPDEVHRLLDRLSGHEHLELRGLMAIAEEADDPEAVRPQFRLMRTLLDTYPASANPRARWGWLSMGMSGDFEVAIEEGATHVRIGSAIFGSRTYP